MHYFKQLDDLVSQYHIGNVLVQKPGKFDAVKKYSDQMLLML